MAAYEWSVPVLVVGGGACGAAAALAARGHGGDVLLVEREAVARGTTAMSQGLICAAGTTAQREAGVSDDAACFLADIVAKTRGLTDLRLARTLAQHAGPTLDWLVRVHDLPWELDVRFRAAYGHSVPRVHGWIGHSGIDMIQLLHARLERAGVDVMTNARLAEIDADGAGRVSGVTLQRPDGSLERIGCETLVLAAGGFAANAAMVAAHIPEAVRARCNGHAGNQGDAITLGARLGAALGDMAAYQGYGMLTDPQGIAVPPGFLIEGGVMVNTRGERFLDETLDIAGMVLPVLDQPGGTAWVIYDAGIEARLAYMPETRQLVELNAARRGNDAAALALAIGAPADALTASLADVHAAWREGRPDAMGRAWGGAVPPALPMRALKVGGALFHTQGGLQIDDQARVLRIDGTAMPNLFAGGGSARGVSGPSSWGYLPAMGLCAAVTLGAMAGRVAATQVTRASGCEQPT